MRPGRLLASAAALCASLLLTAPLHHARPRAWPPHILTPSLDLALPAVGVDPLVQQRQGLAGLTGQGVVIGIIDTGVDWSLPDFLDAQGQPRVLWWLDLSQEPREGQDPAVDSHGGALWSQAELADALLDPPLGPPGDLLGHGTLVAGVAAASGQGRRPDGVAPGAHLVVVRANFPGTLALQEESVLHSVRFVLERAQALGLPAVVNLSLGSHFGPHDGSGFLEQELDALFTDQPGRVLVVATGNSGQRDRHASGPLVPGGELVFPVEIGPVEEPNPQDFALLSLWYTLDPEAPLEVELIDPQGRSTGAASLGQEASLLDPAVATLSVSLERASLVKPGEPEDRGLGVILLQAPPSGPLLPGRYQLVLRGGSGRADAWVAVQGRLGARFLGRAPQVERLTVPSSANAALAVGGWVTRDRWPGSPQDLGLALDEVAPFSGTGPALDGRPKPDLLAPAALIASSLSSQAPPGEGTVFSSALEAGLDPTAGQPAGRALYQGTSLASPLVAGAAALLLEQDPRRRQEEVAGLLRASASRQGKLWDPYSGFGRLDLPAAVALGAQAQEAGPVDPQRSLVAATREALEGWEGDSYVLLRPLDAQGRPRRGPLEIQSRVEAARGEARLGPWRWLDPWTAMAPLSPGSAQGLVRVSVQVQGTWLRQQAQITVGPPLPGQVQGGACAVGAPVGSAGSWLGWWWRRAAFVRQRD